MDGGEEGEGCDLSSARRSGDAEFHYRVLHMRGKLAPYSSTLPSLELVQQRLLSSREQQRAHVVLAGQRHVRAHHTAGRGRVHGNLGPLGGRLVVGVRGQTLRARALSTAAA